MDTLSQLTKFLPIAYGILIVLAWIKLASHIAERSGWSELARFYRLVGEFSGKTWQYQNAKMRNEMNWNDSLTLGVNGQGLYLAPFIFFRPASPPLFVPWHEIRISAEGSSSEWVDFHFRQAPDVWVRINRELMEELEATTGPAWPGFTPDVPAGMER